MNHARLCRGALGVVLSFAMAATTAACARARSDGPSDRAANEAGAPIDAALMAYLSEARAIHHEASVHEAAGDVAGAIAALERLVGAKAPRGNAPEVSEVLADAYARLAELRAKSGDVEGAERDVDRGLAHAPSRTYFRGHLLEVSGVVEEARAASLADAGATAEAASARASAVARLREAVSIQDEVIRGALGDGGENR